MLSFDTKQSIQHFTGPTRRKVSIPVAAQFKA